ncbi:DinB family protein [Parapedobacter deserti]|uniref:DinB family protein n=1 Tax=Parapedobacter deserti TaxID=1912957 RepID=A0ABV7JEM3_9SPHI
MNETLERLFAYNHQCNQQLAAILHKQSAVAGAKSISIFSHILSAHHIWNHRIAGQSPAYNVWELHPTDAFEAIDRHNHDQTITVLDTVDLTTEITYVNSKGQRFANTAGDIFLHVINHTTYHRGQLALLFRQNGMEPLATDYILYRR